ncbi:serine protease [Candidatus Parcubacteria bacterium]|nr:MAG: serine protease [Candidatus Parcubacteria bacterium]
MDLKFWQKNKESFLKTVIIAVVFGFLAGIVGQMVARVYLDPYNLALNYGLDDEKIYPRIDELKKFSGSEYDEIIGEVAENSAKSIARLYYKKNASEDILKTLYSDADFAGNAFILTTDGWMISVSELLSKEKREIVVAVDGKIYKTEKKIVDPVTGLAFFKINGTGFSTMALGDIYESGVGQTVLAVNSYGNTVLTHIENLNYHTEIDIKSSDKYYDEILLKDGLSSRYAGSVLVNYSGEIIGVVSSGKDIKTAIPVNNFKRIIPLVLRQEKLTRPILGLDYIDLAEKEGYGQSRGAFVYKDPVRGTPAASAGIKKGDLISKVDGINVDKNSSLNQLILQNNPKDRVELTLNRDGREMVVEVVLGEGK